MPRIGLMELHHGSYSIERQEFDSLADLNNYFITHKIHAYFLKAIAKFNDELYNGPEFPYNSLHCTKEGYDWLTEDQDYEIRVIQIAREIPYSAE